MEDDPAMCEGINSGAFTHSSAIEVLSLLEIYKYILIHNTFYYLNYYTYICVCMCICICMYIYIYADICRIFLYTILYNYYVICKWYYDLNLAEL